MEPFERNSENDKSKLIWLFNEHNSSTENLTDFFRPQLVPITAWVLVELQNL